MVPRLWLYIDPLNSLLSNTASNLLDVKQVKQTFQKILIVIIDALRHDFVTERLPIVKMMQEQNPDSFVVMEFLR
jgi:predicted AlkP superfamily pyrophosphatase or phosphodiesterase